MQEDKKTNLIFLVILLLIFFVPSIYMLAVNFDNILAIQLNIYRDKCSKKDTSACYLDVIKKHPIVSKRYYNILQSDVARCYLYEKRLKESKEIYKNILANEKNDKKLIAYVENNLRVIDNLEKSSSETASDYYNPNDITPVWQKPFSIKVYIEDKSPKRQYFIKAFNTWKQKSNGMFDFTYVADKNKADITCRFVDKLSKSHVDYGLGMTYFTYRKVGSVNYFHKADIEIMTKVGDKVVDDNIVYKTILHEVGHSLGLQHSPYKSDIMYESSVLDKNDLYNVYYADTVSVRDINTLKKIYDR